MAGYVRVTDMVHDQSNHLRRYFGVMYTGLNLYPTKRFVVETMDGAVAVVTGREDQDISDLGIATTRERKLALKACRTFEREMTRGLRE